MQGFGWQDAWLPPASCMLHGLHGLHQPGRSSGRLPRWRPAPLSVLFLANVAPCHPPTYPPVVWRGVAWGGGMVWRLHAIGGWCWLRVGHLVDGSTLQCHALALPLMPALAAPTIAPAGGGGSAGGSFTCSGSCRGTSAAQPASAHLIDLALSGYLRHRSSLMRSAGSDIDEAQQENDGAGNWWAGPAPADLAAASRCIWSAAPWHGHPPPAAGSGCSGSRLVMCFRCSSLRWSRSTHILSLRQQQKQDGTG